MIKIEKRHGKTILPTHLPLIPKSALKSINKLNKKLRKFPKGKSKRYKIEMKVINKNRN